MIFGGSRVESLNIYRYSSILTLPVDFMHFMDLHTMAKGRFSFRRKVCHVQSLSSTSISCLSETDFPKFIGSLYCIEVLDLSSNNFH